MTEVNMQVPVSSMVFMAVSVFVSIGLPVTAFVFLKKKYKAVFFPVFAGAAAFFLAVLVLESSVHAIVLKNFDLKEKPFLFVLYGIFMAGIFEETARFITFNILKKKHDGIKTGLCYGVGHGGIEAIMIGGFAMISSVVFSILINTGNFDTVIAGLNEAESGKNSQIVEILMSTAPYMFLLSGIERAFAFFIQMSLSVLVFYSVYSNFKKRLWLFPCAVLLHAIIDIPAAMYQAGVITNLIIIEGIIFVFTIACILIAVNVHRRLKLCVTTAQETEMNQ